MNLVIFDVDGTLLDNQSAEDACFADALRVGFGITSFSTDWHGYEHVSDQGIAVEAYTRAFGHPPSAAEISATVDLFVDRLARMHVETPIVAIAGASQLLAQLPRHDWAVAIATGAWRRAAEWKLSAAGISFERIPMATAEDGPARRDIVRAARQRAEVIGGHFERVVMVGDAPWDLDTARLLDLPFVGVGKGPHATRLQFLGASHVLCDFANDVLSQSALEQANVPLTAPHVPRTFR